MKQLYVSFLLLLSIHSTTRAGFPNNFSTLRGELVVRNAELSVNPDKTAQRQAKACRKGLAILSKSTSLDRDIKVGGQLAKLLEKTFPDDFAAPSTQTSSTNNFRFLLLDAYAGIAADIQQILNQLSAGISLLPDGATKSAALDAYATATNLLAQAGTAGDFATKSRLLAAARVAAIEGQATAGCVIPGSSLTFNGNEVEFSNSSAFYPRGAFTVEFWFRCTGRLLNGCFTVNVSKGAFRDGYYAGIEHNLGDFGGPDGAVFSAVFGKAGYVHAFNYGDYRDGKWHHYAAVYDLDKLLVYIDGLPGDPVNISTSWGGPPVQIGLDSLVKGKGKFYLGQAGEGSHGDGGSVDEFRISKVARYTADFSDRLGELRCLSRDPFTVTYWKLDDGFGDQAIDASGHGHTGRLQGPTLPIWETGVGELTFTD